MDGLLHLLVGLGVASARAEGDVHAISRWKVSQLLTSHSDNLYSREHGWNTPEHESSGGKDFDQA